MHFSLEINHIIYVAALLGAAFVLTVVCAIVLWRRAARLRRHLRYEEERAYLSDEQLPAVSVVVYAHNDAESLERFLPLLMHQDYPQFEVIVVDDGSHDNSRNTLSDMIPHFNNLRVTFSPDDTRALSRKKLSLMIGFKAAKYDVVLTTNANCRVMSDQWLRLMMRNFVPGTDVVLGYSHYRYRKDKTRGRFFRAFDSVVTGTQWLLSAVKHEPYRGVSDNLAYRKELFFRQQGFSRSLDLRFGDDDVFVSEIADATNTRVELAPDSVVQTYYDHVPTAHHILKSRRDYTSQRVSTRKCFYQQAAYSWANYLRVGCLVGAVALDYANLLTIAVAVVLMILSWALTIVPFNRLCTILQAPPLSLSVPFFFLWRPVVNFVTRLRNHSSRHNNLTSVYD